MRSAHWAGVVAALEQQVGEDRALARLEHVEEPPAPGRFGGSVQEQILQQGYVNQPTVSLSKSFQVAAATVGFPARNCD